MLQRRCYLIDRLTAHVLLVVARGARTRSVLDATFRIKHTGVGLTGAFRPFVTALRATSYLGRHLAGTRGYRGTKTRGPRTNVHEVARYAHLIREEPPSRVQTPREESSERRSLLLRQWLIRDARARARAFHADRRSNLHLTISSDGDSCRGSTRT